MHLSGKLKFIAKHVCTQVPDVYFRVLTAWTTQSCDWSGEDDAFSVM